jgi:phenylpropionate dioxygenase-like ring-hydroxylating dioxygenase large terminal subunit
MIRNQWYAIFPSRKLPKKGMTALTRLGERLLLWRNHDRSVNCIYDRCVHRGASLAAGQLVENEPECPFHGLRYNGKGECTLIPANGRAADIPVQFKVRSYHTKDRYGFIWIWWGDLRENYPDLPFFDDIDDSFSWAEREDPWPMHYSRCIENQLDAVHLPFVHRTTIGAGNKTVVNGPGVVLEHDQIRFWVHNELDRGQTPIAPSEYPAGDTARQHLHFIFPHIWQNWLTSKMRIVIAFTPVDEENTLIYLRMYQKVMKIPLLKHIVNAVFMVFNMIILHQDRRVVITQLPKKSTLKMDEQLISGDLPIIEYRKIRDKLLKKQA